MPVTIRFDPTAASLQAQIIPNVSLFNDGVLSAAQYAALAGQVGPAGDRVFFVDAIAGNDSNPGTSALPYQTLMRGLQNFYSNWTGLAELHIVGAGPYAMDGQFYLGKPEASGAELLQIIGDDYEPATGAGTAATQFSVTAAPDGQNVTANLNAALGANELAGAIVKFVTGAAAGQTYIVCTNQASGALNSTPIFFGVGSTVPVAPYAIGDLFTLTLPASTVNASFNVSDGAQIVFNNVILSGSATADSNARLTFNYCQVELGFLQVSDGALIEQAVFSYFNNVFIIGLGVQPSRMAFLACLFEGTVYIGFIGTGYTLSNCYFSNTSFGGEENTPTVEIGACSFVGSPPLGHALSFGKGSTYNNVADCLFNLANGPAILMYNGSWLTGGSNVGTVAGYYIQMQADLPGQAGQGGYCQLTLDSIDAVAGSPTPFLIGDQEKNYADLPFTGHVIVGQGSAAATGAGNTISGLTGLAPMNAGDIITLSGFATSTNNGTFKILYVDATGMVATLAGPVGMITTPDANDGAGVWEVFSIAQPNNSALIYPA